MRSCLAFTLAVLTVAAVPLSAHTPSPGTPLANREHPRIWISNATLPAMRTKLAGPFKTEFQSFVTHLENVAPTEERLEDYVLNYAFVARVGAVPGITYRWAYPAAYTARAKQLLFGLLNGGVSYWPAVAYDWLYDTLTPAERLQIWAAIQSQDAREGIKDPFDDRSGRTVQRRILAGLAFWGDGIADDVADGFLNLFADKVVGGGMLDAANFIAADDGGISEGFSYAARGDESSTVENLMKILEGWRTAHGLTRADVFGGNKAPAVRYFPQWVSYLIRPHGAVNTDRPGDIEYMSYKTHLMEAFTPMASRGPLRRIMASLRMFRDIDPDMASLAEWILQNRTGHLELTGTDHREKALLGHFIFGEKVVARSPAELAQPLTKQFDGLGWVVMRTGWGSLKDTMVTFMASPWRRSSYSNTNQNSFTIDKQGPLALNSGHVGHHNYANQTWASNTMLFVDPASNFVGGDFGGQRTTFGPVLTATLLQPCSIYDLGGVKRLQSAAATGLDFDYVYGDATRAYNGPMNSDGKNSEKVKLFTRQLVNFRAARVEDSDIIVVFDRTESTAAHYEKRWLLHLPFNPAVDGTATVERDGKWVYRNAGLVTATNTAAGSSGKLFSRTLLPEQRTIVKIGGPGHEFEDPFGENQASPSSFWDPNNVYESQYAGTYRVEVIPAIPSTSDLFLHVLQASPSGTTAAVPSVLLQGTGVVGARVGQRIVAFSKTETYVNAGDISVDAGGAYRVVFADLAPGREYDVTFGGAPLRRTASSAGVLTVDITVATNARVAVQIVGSPTTPPAGCGPTPNPNDPKQRFGAPRNVRVIR